MKTDTKFETLISEESTLEMELYDFGIEEDEVKNFIIDLILFAGKHDLEHKRAPLAILKDALDDIRSFCVPKEEC